MLQMWSYLWVTEKPDGRVELVYHDVLHFRVEYFNLSLKSVGCLAVFYVCLNAFEAYLKNKQVPEQVKDLLAVLLGPFRRTFHFTSRVHKEYVIRAVLKSDFC